MIQYDIHGGKGGEEKPHQPVEKPNNLLSTAVAKVLIAVAEGELAGRPTARDIYLNGTPLENSDGSLNFGGVKWEWRTGAQVQEHIVGLPEVSTEYSVGQELSLLTPWNRLVTNTNLDAIRFTISTNAFYQQASNGDTNGVAVEFVMEISTDGGSYVEYERYKIEGKTNAGYEKTYRVDLPKADNNWSLRLRRLTAENESSTIQDTIAVKSFTEVLDVKQTYPNTALLYVEFNSELFGGGTIPRISVRTKGRYVRVPVNYDPESRSYSGIWNGDFKWAWSDNPIWVYYDIITNDRFGLGDKVTPQMVDKYSLYEVSRHCDVMVSKGDGSGQMEPRHTCNIYIQEQRDAWTVLRDIASIFNGMTYWNGNQFVAFADKEEDISDIPIFSRANVANGRFDYQSADEKSIYTSALVSYDDPSDHYNTQVEATSEHSEILRFKGDRTTELSAIGCTSRGEAQRRGKYVLVTNLLDRQVNFRTGLMGMDDRVFPGKVIHVLDPLLGGRSFTGRIKVATPTVITLDRDVVAKAGDILYLTLKNGVTQGRTVISSSGNIVRVSTSYSEIPEPNSVWYLEAADLKSQLFRVTKVSSPAEGVYDIDAVEYNESKYGAIDNGAKLESRPISVVPAGMQQVPKNIKVSSYDYVEQTLSVNVLAISWDQTPNALTYEVQWRVNEGDWVNAGVTGANYLEVAGIYTGRYAARIRATNAGGIKSQWGYSDTVLLNGKAGKPPRLAALITTPMIFGIRLDWQFPENATDTLRTEFMYSQTANFENAIKLGDFAYPTDSHELHGLRAGQQFWFWARIIDRSGNIGEWFPYDNEQGIRGVTLLNDDGAYNDYFAGLIAETALDKDLYDKIELIDGDGPGSVNERLDETFKGVQSEIERLEGEIASITDSFAYDPNKEGGYLKGVLVRYDGKLWQALKDVPTGVAPPNLEYWQDVGLILEDANGLAVQVELNRVGVEVLGERVSYFAQTIESLQAQYREDDAEGQLQDALNGHAAKAAIVQERQVRADADEAFAQELTTYSAELGTQTARITDLTKVVADNDTATSQRLSSLEAQVGDDIQAAIRNEATVRASADEALAEDIRQLSAQVNTDIGGAITEIRGEISEEARVRANADGALSQSVDQVVSTQNTENTSIRSAITTEQNARVAADGAITTRLDQVVANQTTENTTIRGLVTTEQTARTSADEALGQRIDQVSATAGDNSVKIQQAITAQATTDGKVNGAYTLKMEAYSGGQYVAAGIALGVGQQNGLLQSQFLVRADRFAVVNGTSSTTTAPFVVSNGQVFINDVLINKATITSAIIGSYIYSAQNSTWGGPIMQQEFNAGHIRLLHATRNATYTELSRTGLNVIVDGVLRVRMGAWE